MGRIKDYFVEQGLTPADFPVAFVFHEVISVGWAGAVWGACYIQPSVTVCRPLAKLPMASRVSGAFDKALTFSDAKLEKMTWLKKMPAVKHAHPRRLTVSHAESLVFRGAVKPVSSARSSISPTSSCCGRKKRARLATARERRRRSRRAARGRRWCGKTGGGCARRPRRSRWRCRRRGTGRCSEEVLLRAPRRMKRRVKQKSARHLTCRRTTRL